VKLWVTSARPSLSKVTSNWKFPPVKVISINIAALSVPVDVNVLDACSIPYVKTTFLSTAPSLKSINSEITNSSVHDFGSAVVDGRKSGDMKSELPMTASPDA
jgi:hypothetical protein